MESQVMALILQSQIYWKGDYVDRLKFESSSVYPNGATYDQVYNGFWHFPEADRGNLVIQEVLVMAESF